jgi:hypothetical protein
MSEAAVKKSGWRGPAGSINTKGRPKKDEDEKVTRRGVKDKELLALMRKFRPHVSSAVMTAVGIMQDESSADQNRLKASALIIKTYNDLILQAYEGEDEEGEVVQEVQPQVPVEKVPVFSLRMLPVQEDKKVEE